MRGGRLATVGLGLAIVALAVVAYWPALQAGFVYDDHLLIESSSVLRGPLSRIWFSTALLDYWPLTYTTFWVELRLWGQRAAAYHATNVALHAAAAVLFWRVLRALRIPGAWLGGVLFALHPVAVDSVAWISERKNTLSGVLFLGSMLAWVRYDETRRTREWLVSLGLFLLALLAKASVVMLPVVLVGIVWARRGRLARRDWIGLSPYFALSLALGAVTVWFQSVRALGDGIAARGWSERLPGSAWALGSYLKTAFVPVGLSFIHADWPVARTSPWFLAPLVALGLAALALWLLRDRGSRPLLLATGYVAIVVLPVIGLVDMSYFRIAPVSNHLQYLALLGSAAFVAASFDRLGRGRPAAIAAAVALVVAAGVATRSRAATFHDDLTLWRAAAHDAPRSLYAAWMYADALGTAGHREEAFRELAAFAEHTDDPSTRHRARSLWLAQGGRGPEAAAEAAHAEQLRHDGEFQLEIGRLLTKGGHGADAIPLLEALVRAEPRCVDCHYWLAAALARERRTAEAVEVLRTAQRLAPGDPRFPDAIALFSSSR
jgi:hypothetical protein